MAKARILLVEDSRTQGTETKEILEKYGYDVTWIHDGMSVFRRAKEKSCDVIILDSVLPDIGGNEVSRWLKLDQETKGIPIIMLTVKGAVADKVQGYESGADDYFVKPYDAMELNARVYAAVRTKALRDELIHANDELKDMLARAEIMAITDPLTGLFNRRRFESLLDLEFKKAARYASPLSCMMIDIDHFKNVNDTYGHAAGDSVLKDLALIIQRCIREVDTACRWGGEEFVVLTPMTDKGSARQPAGKILRCVSDYVFANIGDHKITVSIGLADISGAGIEDAGGLIHAADLALYEAKKNGRNRIEPAA